MPRGRDDDNLIHMYSASERIKRRRNSYAKYQKEVKKGIISRIKELVKSEKSNEDVVQCINTLEVKAFNKIIQQAFSEYAPTITLSWDPKTLKYLRRKMKDWILNQKKQDNRGDPKVPREKLEDFKKCLMLVMPSFCCRSFDMIKRRLFEIFNELGIEAESCSKHFFYDLKRRYPDISNLYENVPNPRKCSHQIVWSLPEPLEVNFKKALELSRDQIESPLNFLQQPLEARGLLAPELFLNNYFVNV